MTVVCDTCSLIQLRKGGVVDCLGELFERVLIPTAVQAECQDPATAAVLTKDFVEVHEVENVLALSGLGKGEREAISLAVELGIPTVITDDEKAANRAIQQGCKPVKTLQVLLLAKNKELIPSVKDVMDAMIAKGEGIEDSAYEATLSQAGEK